MNAHEFKVFLKSTRACQSAMSWVETLDDQSPENVWKTCPRGDWLLWWHRKAGTDFVALEPVLRKAVNRALKHAKVNLKIVNGTKQEYLDASADAAADAAASAYAYAAAADAYAAADAAAYAAAYAAASADADADAYAYAARTHDLLLTANDCRELLTMPELK